MKQVVNLSNGIDYYRDEFVIGEPDAFLRVQSTWCEQKRWDDVLWTFDPTVFMWLARGEDVLVYDATARSSGRPPRAIWQGLAVVRTVCRHAWGLPAQDEYTPSGAKMTEYMEDVLWSLREGRALTHVRYFGKYLAPGLTDVTLRGEWRETDLDSRYAAQAAILNRQEGAA